MINAQRNSTNKQPFLFWAEGSFTDTKQDSQGLYRWTFLISLSYLDLLDGKMKVSKRNNQEND